MSKLRKGKQNKGWMGNVRRSFFQRATGPESVLDEETFRLKKSECGHHRGEIDHTSFLSLVFGSRSKEKFIQRAIKNTSSTFNTGKIHDNMDSGGG